MRKSDAVSELAALLGESPTELKNYVRVLRESGEFGQSLPGRAANPITEDDLVNLLIGYCASRSAVGATDALRRVRSFTLVDPAHLVGDAPSFDQFLRDAIWTAYSGDLSSWLHLNDQDVELRGLKIDFDQKARDVLVTVGCWKQNPEGVDECVKRFCLRYAARDRPLAGDLRASRAIGIPTLVKVGQILVEGAA